MSSKTLYRSRFNRVVSGVCGGLGNHFGLDPIIFRFAFVALILAGGSGFFLYLIMLVVIPKEPLIFTETNNLNVQQPEVSSFEKFQNQELNNNEPIDQTRVITGLLLISGGILFLLNNLVPFFKIGKWWPIILVIIGLSLLFQSAIKKDKKKEEETYEK